MRDKKCIINVSRDIYMALNFGFSVFEGHKKSCDIFMAVIFGFSNLRAVQRVLWLSSSLYIYEAKTAVFAS